MKPIYQLFPGPKPAIILLDIKWIRQNEKEVQEWCEENNIQMNGWEIYLNSIDEATMFKLRFGV